MINAKEFVGGLLEGRYDDWCTTTYYREYGMQEMVEFFGKEWELHGWAKPDTYYLICHLDTGQTPPPDLDMDFTAHSEKGNTLYIYELQ